MKLKEDLLAIRVKDVADSEIHRMVLQIHNRSSHALDSVSFQKHETSYGNERASYFEVSFNPRISLTVQKVEIRNRNLV